MGKRLPRPSPRARNRPAGRDVRDHWVPEPGLDRLPNVMM
ncbi:MAG: hypothetical protein K0S78_2071, partial [Thermomicrobiales bacterium]|nr:hypothetical protein [Thermomicrobiales bacterium]